MPTQIRNPFDSGAGGGILITTAGNTRTGDFYAIQIVSAAVFSNLTGNLGGDAYTGVTFPAGTTIYGAFSSVTLTSGTVIAYRI